MAEPVRCDECGGNGWILGDCHPAEICGACNGFGTIDPSRHPDDVFDGQTVRREPTHMACMIERSGR